MKSMAAQSGTDPTKAPAELVRHLTQLDLARRWRISPRTLERWRWLRQGPAYLKLGGALPTGSRTSKPMNQRSGVLLDGRRIGRRDERSAAQPGIPASLV